MTSLNNFNLIFYDLETTSLNLFQARILEIAACYSDGETFFHRYVKHPWPIDNSHIHGITHEVLDAKEAQYLIQVLNAFEAWVLERYPDKDTPIYLTAHNNLGYDKWILEINYRRLDRKMPNNWRFMDTLPQFRALCSLNSYKLTNIYISFFQTELVGAHGALADTKALFMTYNHLMNNVFFKDESRDKIQSWISSEIWNQVGWTNVATSIFSGFLSSQYIFSQLSSFHPDALYQKIEIFGIKGYPLYRFKQRGLCDVKDILIFYLIVYPNFVEPLSKQTGVTSKYYLDQMKKYLDCLVYILYGFEPGGNESTENISSVRKKIKII